VIGQYGGGIATGTVTFRDRGRIVAKVSVNDNHAACNRSYAGAGVRTIIATYSGDSNNEGSTSPVLNEAIGKLPYPSSTVLSTSGSPSLVGQPVTFTATVTFRGGAVPNGELVTFFDGHNVIGTGTTVGGVAMFTTSSLVAKTHTIKGTYAGDATLKPSSGAITQVVN
jgi:hypothetical protein